MNTITPHLSEEINALAGSDKLVSADSWPDLEEKMHNIKAEAGEEMVQASMEGMRNVIQLAKLETPKKFTLFIAEKWLYELFNVLHKEMNVTRNIGEVMKKVLEAEELKMKGKEVSKIVTSILKDPSKMPHLVTSQEDELKVMMEAKSFLEKEYTCPVEIIVGEESEHPKAKSAMPGKVGILVE